MNTTYHEIIELLRKGFAESNDRQLKTVYLNNAAHLLQAEDESCRQSVLQYMLKSGKRLAGNQQLLLKSLIFFLAKTDAAIKDVAGLIPTYVDDLEAYHFLIWKIRHSLFNFGGNLLPETAIDIRENYIRTSYHKVFDAINECVHNDASFRPAPQLRKVAIVLSQFLGELHAPSRTALMMATGLTREYGLEVHIINSNLLPVTRPLDYFYGLMPNINASLKGKQRASYNDPEFGSQIFQVKTQAPSQFNLSSLVDFWNELESENYDAFINLGDVLFATDYFFGKLPILSIPTVKDIPVSYADQVIFAQETVTPEEKEILQKNFPYEPILGFSFNLASRTIEMPVSKSQFNLPEESFVFVVVGNRLAYEMDSTFIAMLFSLLEADPKNHVLFVSGQERLGDFIRQQNKGFEERFKTVGFQPNLKGFYAICDVYLNPSRAGGGVSAQMALAEHIPVLTTHSGDVASLVPQNWRFDSYLEMGALAIKLSQNPETFAEWKTKMAEFSSARLSGQHNIDILYQRLQALHQDILERSALSEESMLDV